MHILGLNKFFWRWRRPKPKNKVLVLLDLENLLLNINSTSPFEFSLVEGFTKIMRKLGEFGRVVEVFVFGPPPTINLNLSTLHQMGFRAITCPKVIIEKTGPRIDTVDSEMIDFGKKMIAEMANLTYLCLGSGDKDFIPLIREAERCGLKIVIVAGNKDSLSEELTSFVCRNPVSGEKAIYFFSPKKDTLNQ